MIAVPSTTAEENHHGYRASSYADLTTDSTPSVSIPQSGDLSPRKFQPASRRLSAFFKLQEQNIVSLLNKRLQQHQEELKRVERMSDNILNVAIQRMSSHQEQDRRENKLEQEFEERDSEKKPERDLSSSSLQLREQGGKAKALGTDWHEGIQDTSSESAHRDMKKEQLDDNHGCAWKQMASKPGLPSAHVSAKVGEEEACDIGITGIREDVMIKADLSQGI